MAGNGGAWKVAYADFVTAMMALFLVLWLVAQDQSVREAVEKAFRSQFVTTTTGAATLVQTSSAPAVQSIGQSRNSDSPFEMQVIRRILDQLQALNTPIEGENRPIHIRITAEGLEISIFDRANKPLFVGESDRLTIYGRWVFSTLAWPISDNPGVKIEIAGHTESGYQANSRDYSGWELSADRAKTVRRILMGFGVSDDQVRKVSGFGDTIPLPDTDPADPENRRVTVFFKLRTPFDPVETSNDS